MAKIERFWVGFLRKLFHLKALNIVFVDQIRRARDWALAVVRVRARPAG
jgi:hypothetical protein